LGSRVSLVWRSLFHAKRLLSQGILWRVRNGSSIRIWKDRWIPSSSTHLVHSPVGGLGQNATASDLIDKEGGCWNSLIISENFMKEEAKAILNIPLSPILPQDWIIWIGSKSGMFTVKSAYHIGRVLKEDARGQCSNAARMPDIWRDLWNLKIPGKVKLFAWRACQNLLPTRDNLYKRKVIQDPICPCCGLEVETIIHSLRSYSAAQDVWGDNLSCFQKCSSSQISFLLLLDSCFRIYDKEKVELLLVVARNIWLGRNSLLFEGCFLPPRRIWEDFISFLEDYRNSLQEEENVNKVLNLVAHLSPEVWHPPPTDHFKINWMFLLI
jgi:hypothetical protein